MSYLAIIDAPSPEDLPEFIVELPEGTHALDIQAFWSVTDPDGKFRGGAVGWKWEKPADQFRDPCPDCGSNRRHPTLAYILHEPNCTRRERKT